MSTITYTKATINDVDSFYPFFAKSLRELFPHYAPSAIDSYLNDTYTPARIQKRIKNKTYFLYLAYADKEYAGYFLTADVYGGVGRALWIAVAPQYQNHGIATTLLGTWEKDTIKAGGHAVELWTTENNRNFYKNRGYTFVGAFPNAWFHVDYYYFAKQLPKQDREK